MLNKNGQLNGAALNGLKDVKSKQTLNRLTCAAVSQPFIVKHTAARRRVNRAEHETDSGNQWHLLYFITQLYHLINKSSSEEEAAQ